MKTVDVPHDGDDGRALDAVVLHLDRFNFLGGLLLVADLVRGGAEFARDLLGGLDVKGLVDGGVNLAVEELLDDEVRLHGELFGKLFYGDAFGDGDFAIDGRRSGRLAPPHGHAEFTLFRLMMPFARGRLRRVAALLFGSRYGDRLEASGRRGMHGTHAAPIRTGWSLARKSGTAHDGLAGANRAPINRLAGNGSRGPRWYAGTRQGRAGHRPCLRLLLLQARDHVGIRWHDGPRRGLAGESGAHLLAQGNVGRWRRGCRFRRGIDDRSLRSEGPRHRRRPRSAGHGGCGRFDELRWRCTRRHRLPRAGKNLPGFGGGRSGDGSRLHRRPQRRRDRRTARERWAQGCWLVSNFFGRRGCCSLFRWGRWGRRALRFSRRSRGGRLSFDNSLERGRLVDDCRTFRGSRLLLFLGAWLRDRGSVSGDPEPDLFGHVVIDGAGVRFLLGHAEFGQHLEDLVRGDLKLSRQLVYADFLHSLRLHRTRTTRLRSRSPSLLSYQIRCRLP